jgi:hypothetical protein
MVKGLSTDEGIQYLTSLTKLSIDFTIMEVDYPPSLYCHGCETLHIDDPYDFETYRQSIPWRSSVVIGRNIRTLPNLRELIVDFRISKLCLSYNAVLNKLVLYEEEEQQWQQQPDAPTHQHRSPQQQQLQLQQQQPPPPPQQEQQQHSTPHQHHAPKRRETEAATPPTRKSARTGRKPPARYNDTIVSTNTYKVLSVSEVKYIISLDINFHLIHFSNSLVLTPP